MLNSLELIEKIKNEESKLYIITGRNGTGKTKLLEAIKSELTRNDPIIYMSSDQTSKFQFSGNFGDNYLDKSTIERIRSAFVNDLCNLTPFEDVYFNELKSKNIRDANEIDKYLRDKKIADVDRSNYFNYLDQLFGNHIRRFNNHKTSYTQDYDEVYRFYRENNMNNELLEMKEFIAEIKKNNAFAREIVNEYAYSASGFKTFIINFNEILKNVKFSYTFKIDYKNENDPIIMFEKGGKCINSSDFILSSGQVYILKILAWQYGLDDNSKIKYMLLDEPDKHFDPHLCEQFFNVVSYEFINKARIKIIMTTHRLDTVSLAKKENLYEVDRNENDDFIIKPVHKLEASLKMSSNFRQLSNFHFKVYTESLDDSYFYEAIYKSLKALYQSNRDKKQYWLTINSKPFRILSNRCQLSFYSVSLDKKRAGGCNVVK
jgi:ABC-type Mn2+/Zn2+ transport system ATPase subunit